jgi:hypothetical protein
MRGGHHPEECQTPLTNQCRRAYLGLAVKCIFCGRPAPGRWALTVKSVTGVWRRVIEPVCPRCHRLLPPSGQVGLRLRATGEHWYGGHRVGRFWRG